MLIKLKSTHYIKEQDKVYCDLLKLASVSDNTHYTPFGLDRAINTLNQLAEYAKVHQRIISLLNTKAHKLAIYDGLTKQTKQILLLGTQQGIITELAKTKQLNQILDALLAENIPVILLKGVAFSNTLYSSDAPRTSNDIDLLVKKEHWLKATTAVETIMNPLVRDKKDVFDDLYESSFLPKEQIGAALDLHVSLVHPELFSIEEKSLWGSSVKHPNFNNELIKQLSPEHTLVHQAIHAFKDMNFCKYNLLDSHEVINKLNPNIAQTIKISKEWGASIVLFHLLKNCIRIMGTKIDEQLLEQVKPNVFVQGMAGKLLSSPFAQPSGKRKSLRYRLNQFLSQFIFTGSLLRPIAFQCLFVKTAIQQKF